MKFKKLLEAFSGIDNMKDTYLKKLNITTAGLRKQIYNHIDQISITGLIAAAKENTKFIKKFDINNEDISKFEQILKDINLAIYENREFSTNIKLSDEERKKFNTFTDFIGTRFINFNIIPQQINSILDININELSEREEKILSTIYHDVILKFFTIGNSFRG